MKPLKFSEVVAETAARTGQPVEVTAALLRIYFKDLRTALTSLAYPHVRVLNLGTFCLKPFAVEKKLSRRLALLDSLEADPTRGQAIKEDVVQDVERLKQALVMMERERERKGVKRRERDDE
jgi:hypothetical protein